MYREQSIKQQLPSGTYSIDDLEELFILCLKIHQECCEKIKAEFISGNFVIDGVDGKNHEQVEKHIKENYTWALEFLGSNGEYLSINDENTIERSDLPVTIKRIQFGNCFNYEFFTKRKPPVHFEVVIDFTERNALNLIAVPPLAPLKASFLKVTGLDQTMVVGIAGRIETYCRKFENYNFLINVENIYSYILWFIFSPILLTYLWLYKNSFPNDLINSPLYLQTILAILTIFFSLVFYRLIFNIAQWLFPPQELSNQIGRGRKLAKYSYSLIVAGVLGTIGYNFVSWILGRLAQ